MLLSLENNKQVEYRVGIAGMRSQKRPWKQTIKYRGRCNLLPVTGFISAVSIIALRYRAFSLKDSINKDKIGISPINRDGIR